MENLDFSDYVKDQIKENMKDEMVGFTALESIKIGNHKVDYELHFAAETAVPEISIPEFKKRQKENQFFVIDVREYHEYPTIDFADLHVPASELSAFNNELPGNKDICVICQHGIRSVYAAAQLQQHTQQKVYSLKGGLTAYFNQ